MSKNLCERYSSTEVKYRFCGYDIRMLLSGGLFSSRNIDSGTLLLLKMLGQSFKNKEITSFFDVGCGCGAITLALAARYPNAKGVGIDRDALAVAYASYNASLNRLANLEFGWKLAGEEAVGGGADLIVSNIPAKIGSEPLKKFIEWLPSCLTSDGSVAVVIVEPLADIVRSAIAQNNFTLLDEEQGERHRVFHFYGKNSERGFPYSIYSRREISFQEKKTQYTLETAYNIPEFDTVSYSTLAAFDLLGGESMPKNLICIEPGQGHLPVFLSKKKNSAIKRITLCGRDRLALLFTQSNLLKNGYKGAVDIYPVASPEEMPTIESPSFVIVRLNPIPQTKWIEPLKGTIRKTLAQEDRILFLGRSVDIHRLWKEDRGFTRLKETSAGGYRALLLKKK